MSQQSNWKLWNVYKREVHPYQVAISILLYLVQQLDLGLPFPTRLEGEVVPKGEGHPNRPDGCFSWQRSMIYALGRWPRCHAHHGTCGLEIPLCSFSKGCDQNDWSHRSWDSLWDGADPHWQCRLPVLLGQGNERRIIFYFNFLQPWTQLLMAEKSLQPPKIASCWKEVMQCTPQYAYWFLFLVPIKIYFSSLQVNSDLGHAAFHTCSLGQWILVSTSGAINSCLLFRYFNVNKWPHGSERGAVQQLKNQSLFSSLLSHIEGAGSEID